MVAERLCLCQAPSLAQQRDSLKLAIKRMESDFFSNTLEALMHGSTTPEKKQRCHCVGKTSGTTVSSPRCANTEICHTVQISEKRVLSIKPIHSANCQILFAVVIYLWHAQYLLYFPFYLDNCSYSICIYMNILLVEQ